MKRYMSSNVCFNFFTDPDMRRDDDVGESICNYDVYIIFAECYDEEMLSDQIDEAEKLVYGIVSSKNYTDDEVTEEIRACLDKLYFYEDPVIDVIIKKRKFPVKSTETGRNEVSMEG